jgi:hypothetical protein
MLLHPAESARWGGLRVRRGARVVVGRHLAWHIRRAPRRWGRTLHALGRGGVTMEFDILAHDPHTGPLVEVQSVFPVAVVGVLCTAVRERQAVLLGDELADAARRAGVDACGLVRACGALDVGVPEHAGGSACALPPPSRVAGGLWSAGRGATDHSVDASGCVHPDRDGTAITRVSFCRRRRRACVRRRGRRTGRKVVMGRVSGRSGAYERARADAARSDNQD